MNPEPNQTQDLSPDQTASSLAFATHIHEQMMPKDQPVDSSQDPSQDPFQNPQNDQQGQPEDYKQVELNIMDELKSLKEQVKALDPKAQREEMDSIRKELEAILNSNG